MIRIPDHVEAINYHAFSDCFFLKEIHLPENLQCIESHAFWCCRSLEHIHIPDGNQNIDVCAFLHCSSLRTIDWNGNVYRIKCLNGCCVSILSQEEKDDTTVYKCNLFPEQEILYGIEKEENSALGRSIHEAIHQLTTK